MVSNFQDVQAFLHFARRLLNVEFASLGAEAP
jgi:hypothetical protein